MRREAVFERDGYRCVYCGTVFPAEELTVDHVQPRLRGGDNSAGNLVTACGGCNVTKGHRRVADFLRDDAAVQAGFLTRAVHLWPRILRTLLEDLTGRSP
ncbi:MAG: hypothetical protein NVS9B3_05930 [Gemmatimonadaceae bacterium]